MSYLSDFLGKPSLLAGQAISAKDVVLAGIAGKAFPGGTSDYMAVANVGASAVAQSSIIGGKPTAGRFQIIRDTDGYLYIAASRSGSNGCTIYKYAPGGGTPVTLDISTAASSVSPMIMKKLSNGNFVIVYSVAGALKFAIFSPAMAVVVAETGIETVSGPADLSSAFDMVVLTGGGFAVTYRQAANADWQRLAIYSNAGAAVLAPTTVKTWAGTPGNTYTAMVELSNGNIAIACNTLFSTSVGTWHGIFSAVGATVLAFTQLSATMGGAYIPIIATSGAFYSVATTDGTNLKIWVLSNAGVVQGSPYSTADTSPWTAGGNRQKLLGDGTQFWLVVDIDSSVQYVIKIPTSGTNYVSTRTDLSDGPFDAFIENGYLVYVRMGGGSAEQNKVAVFDLTTLTTVVPLTAFGSAPSANSGSYLAAIPVGDLCFAAVYDYATVAGSYFCIAKYADSAILGVAVNTAAAGALVTLTQVSGVSQVNAVKGTTPKAFNHTRACNIQGNAGTIMTNSVILTGITQSVRNIN